MAQATLSCPFGAIHLEDRRGTAQDERFALIFALPPAPHNGGRVPAGFCRITGAQNLSGFPRFLPGHWALTFPELQLVRSHSRAWLCRAGGDRCWAVGRGLLDAPRTSAGRPVSGPYERKGRFRVRRRDGAKARPPGFQIYSHKTVGATLAVARAGCRIRFRFPS